MSVNAVDIAGVYPHADGGDGRAQPVKQDDAAFTGRVGLSYLFDGGLAPYVSYATSFQPTSGTNRLGSPFAPTTGDQVEAGIKFQPTGSSRPGPTCS